MNLAEPSGAPATSSRPRKTAAISQYLDGGPECASSPCPEGQAPKPVLPRGKAVAAAEMRLSLVVVRGPHWRWGQDDGGPGRPGVVLVFDPKAKLATVFWHDTGVVRACYRFGKFTDLALVDSGARRLQPRLSGRLTAGAGRAPLLRALRGAEASKSWAEPACAPASPTSSKESGPSGIRAIVRAMALFRGFRRRHASGCGAEAPADEQPAEFVRAWSSQAHYADKCQTAIIFDWDDTLFPSTYAFASKAGPRLEVAPMQKQDHLSNLEKTQVGRNLMRCAMRVDQLLTLAASLGSPIIVTLAETGWVESVCRYFFPGVARLLEELDVGVVYAKSLMSAEDKLRQPSDPSTEEGKLFWSQVKGKAVAQELKRFYSQYEGQSWKNVVSIGDADFERLGTRLVMAEHQKELGLFDEGDFGEFGHINKVRTKTFKMIETPMVDDLEAQHSLLLKWLPLIVKLDANFDASLNDMDDSEEIRAIGDELEKGQPAAKRKQTLDLDLSVVALDSEGGHCQDQLPDVPAQSAE